MRDLLYFYLFVAVTTALTTVACTKQIPIKVVETRVVTVEVPTPVLQRCRRPPLPAELPTPEPYTCQKDHLCFDAENKDKLEQVFGLMIWYIDWLETSCTEHTAEEAIQSVNNKEGPIT